MRDCIHLGQSLLLNKQQLIWSLVAFVSPSKGWKECFTKCSLSSKVIPRVLPCLSSGLGESKSHFLFKGDVTLPQKKLYLFRPIHHFSLSPSYFLHPWESAHIYHVCYNLHCISLCRDDGSLPNKSAWKVVVLLSHSDGRCVYSVNHCEDPQAQLSMGAASAGSTYTKLALLK